VQVAELSQYSIKNPLKSPLLWGTYDVLYCSKPTAVGGPLKSGAGQQQLAAAAAFNSSCSLAQTS
jgi:hypothetical protein